MTVVSATVDITPILKSLQWAKVNKRIEYKLLALAYKVLTTSKPSYLTNMISVQPSHRSHSSSTVTLSRPQKVTDRPFRYASPCLWNQLPDSFCQPRQSPPNSLVSSSLSSSITPSLYHCRLKTYLVKNPSHLCTSTRGQPSQAEDRTTFIMLLDLFLLCFSLILCYL